MKRTRWMLLLIVFLSVASLPAQTTGSLPISGTVPLAMGIRSNITRSEVFDLARTTSLTLGSITVYSNSSSPWIITITSQNGGVMRGASAANTDNVPYRLRLGGLDQLDLSSVYSLTYNTRTAGGGIELPISVDFLDQDGNVQKYADTYDDIVTITISVT